MNKESKDLLQSAKGVRELRQRAQEEDIELGRSLRKSKELEDIQIKAREMLHLFLEQNKENILKNLEKIKGIERIADKDRSLFSTLQDLLEVSLDRLIKQELIVLQGSTVTSKIGVPTIKEESEDVLKKMIKGLILNYFIALKEIQKNNLNPTYSKKFLENIYKIDPFSISKLLKKFEKPNSSNVGINTDEDIEFETELEGEPSLNRSTIIVFAVSSRNAEQILTRAENNLNFLYNKYKNNPYITVSFIKLSAVTKDPEKSLLNMITKIEELSKKNPDLRLPLIKYIYNISPDNVDELVKTFRQNMRYINSLNIQISNASAEKISLKAKNENMLKDLINKYLEDVAYLTKKFPEYDFYINSTAHTSRDTLERRLTNISNQVNLAFVSSELPEEFKDTKSKIIRVALLAGENRDLMENLKITSQYFKALKKYFNENDEILQKISSEYETEFININYVSPISSFEDNKKFFAQKLVIFKSLLVELQKKFGDPKKKDRKENRAYVSYLLLALYTKNPKEYLKRYGFEI